MQNAANGRKEPRVTDAAGCTNSCFDAGKAGIWHLHDDGDELSLLFKRHATFTKGINHCPHALVKAALAAVNHINAVVGMFEMGQHR